MSEIIKIGADDVPSEELLTRIQILLASGGTIVYRTRTLYGLGAGMSSIDGIVKLLKMKKRPYGPISVMLNRDQLTNHVEIPIKALALVDSGLPLSLVLPAKSNVPSILTDNGSLAVRISDSQLISSIIEKVGPLTTTSANKHDGAEPISIDIAREELGDLPDIYLDSGSTEFKTASTIVDLTDNHEAKILRIGAFSEEQVRELYGK